MTVLAQTQKEERKKKLEGCAVCSQLSNFLDSLESLESKF